MTQTVTLKYTVPISATQEQVFDYLTKWEKQSEWIALTTVKKTSSGSNKKGTTIAATTGVGPLEFVDTMVVEEWQPPQRCVVVHTGKVVRGKGVFSVQKVTAEQSIFLWEEIMPIPLGKFGLAGFTVVKPVMHLMFNRSLKKLKNNIEQAN